MSGLSKALVRDALLGSLPTKVDSDDTAPELRFMYTPAGHRRALNLDHPVVVGGRGMGKSAWSRALISPAHRAQFPQLADVQASLGFAASKDVAAYPSATIIQELMARGIDADTIWRTVIASATWAPMALWGPLTWFQRAELVRSQAEEFERAMAAYEASLTALGQRRLIVFDALDRTANDWAASTEILRGLLRLVLEYRTSKVVRLKVFVRPDMLERPGVYSFPDSSKLKQGLVSLSWTPWDLYGLLFQHLGNDLEHGAAFRGAASEQLRRDAYEQRNDVFVPAELLRAPGAAQEALFRAMAGAWMGANPRRGATYPWIPNHLADTRAEVSPRSFLLALRAAAERTPVDHVFALEPEAIKAGVQQASKVRVDEVMEDYPWLEDVMRPLGGLSVPIEPAALIARWRERGLPDSLERRDDRLPPSGAASGPEGLIEGLRTIGLLSVMSDGRVNIPDVYRIGFSIGRRGGVRAIARSAGG